MSLIGKTLEETEALYNSTAKKITSNEYEIIIKKYCFGLFYKRLQLKCNKKGIIILYRIYTDLR